jgi:hypothetical protein
MKLLVSRQTQGNRGVTTSISLTFVRIVGAAIVAVMFRHNTVFSSLF